MRIYVNVQNLLLGDVHSQYSLIFPGKNKDKNQQQDDGFIKVHSCDIVAINSLTATSAILTNERVVSKSYLPSRILVSDKDNGLDFHNKKEATTKENH